MILLNKGAADAAVHLITDNSCRMNKVIVINAISGYVLWSDSSVRLDEAHSSLYIHEIHLKFGTPGNKSERPCFRKLIVRSDHVAVKAVCDNAAQPIQLGLVDAGMVQQNNGTML